MKMGKLPLTFLFSFILFNCNCFHVNEPIDEKTVEEMAMKLRDELLEFLNKYSGIHALKKAYTEVGDKVKLTALDGEQIVSKMSSDLSKKLEKTMEALKRSVTAAEKIIEDYKYNPDLREGKVDWLNSKDLLNSSMLHYDSKFKKEISFAASSVHIPVEIYDGNVEILNGLRWSSNLDKVFQENSENDPELLWQYFGSLNGFMRMYPANSWTDIQPDLFDVRQRPWFIHGSSSPKTMLILIDISGSMHGLTMSILKMAVKMLLYTLGENDYVNAASFKNKVTWMSCLNTFVPATRRNKKLLSEAINDLVEGEMANLSAALEFAFKEFRTFEKDKQPWEGSNCNQMIVILSDGGTDEAWEVLKHYKEDSKKVRIFTYAIGAHPVPYIPLKTLACTYRGYFTIISSMGTIRTRIQEYLKVLSRPMALNIAREYHWTNFYMDPSGLGMLTVVTLPVYNKTKDNRNPSLVGVMGIDVSMKNMMTTEPKFQVGFVGYSFAITRNGYLVFHPNLHIKIGQAGYFLSLRRNDKDVNFTPDSKFSQATYLDNPPDVDLLDIEITDSIRENVSKRFNF
ncbi:voltage-dependent calcium channel subunit alpha-2/delta-1-like isoform X1 [Centruroides sculpturatus]|uniref:voltage-dependent calcium channel subunit alpha-2/delta-1-like isoform X1 n=2 Tax=Centruroides sculpturatus TaxID=218467 RepID=UPI000C6D705E|nr:voltage-dependent calcium channel subunit alpha-2/delta-1-like isoform X1 [Centruroides sculpturatus]